VTAFVEYTRPVFETVFGTVGRIDELTLSGKTDLQFIADALVEEGFTPDDIHARLAEIDACYLKEIERFANDGDSFYILPGVKEFLKAVSAERRYRSAIVTGNFKSAAEFKLSLLVCPATFNFPARSAKKLLIAAIFLDLPHNGSANTSDSNLSRRSSS
jgi:hypothetical protein